MVHLVVDSLDICISFLGAIKYNIYISWESQPNVDIFTPIANGYVYNLTKYKGDIWT